MSSPASPNPTGRLPLYRPYRSLTYPGAPRRVLFGVAAGLAVHLNMSVTLIRVLLVVGVFVPPFTVLYPLLVALIPSGNPWSEGAIKVRQERGALARSLNETRHDWTKPADPSERSSQRLILLVAVSLLLVAGVISVIYFARVELNLSGFQIILGLAGLALTWSQNDRLLKNPAVAVLLISAGLIMVSFSVISSIMSHWPDNSLWRYLVTGIAVVFSVLVAVLPVLLQTNKQLSHSQVQRAQESQRADIAAHLHDSVLQTLALIRQQCDDPQAVASLARRQERELRNWLYGDHSTKEATFTEVVKQTLAQIEDKNNCSIELVNVGDCPATERTYALAAALGEATNNAVKHANAPYSVYVEVTADKISAFVRDRGPGFDLDSIPQDRHGVRDSIVGRLQRLGGQATIKSDANGTEVSLSISREEP